MLLPLGQALLQQAVEVRLWGNDVSLSNVFGIDLQSVVGVEPTELIYVFPVNKRV